jgi:hypothetical protein
VACPAAFTPFEDVKIRLGVFFNIFGREKNLISIAGDIIICSFCKFFSKKEANRLAESTGLVMINLGFNSLYVIFCNGNWPETFAQWDLK